MKLRPFVKSSVLISICILLFTASSTMAGDAILEQMHRIQRDANPDHCSATIDKYQQIIKDHPRSKYAMHAHSEIAVVCIKAKDTAGADAAVQQLLSEYADDSNVPACVRMICDAYGTANQPDKVRQLCRLGLSKWPEHREAILMQSNLIIASVQLGEYAQAEAETDRLVADYAGNKSLPKAVRCVAVTYSQAEQDDKALELYRMLTTSWPDHKETILAQADLAINHIRRGNYKQTDTIVENLVAHYSESADAGRCVLRIGEAYSKAGKNKKAEALRQLASTKWPQEDIILPQRDLAIKHILQGTCEEADTVVQTLLASHSGSSRVGDCAWEIATAYYSKKEYEKAKKLCQTVFMDWPDYSHKPDTVSALMNSMIELGEYDQAVQIATDLIENKSDSKYSGRYRHFAHEALARLYAITGDAAKADKERRKADQELGRVLDNSVQKSDMGAVLRLGENYLMWAEALQENHQEQADAAYSRAIEIWQKNIEQPNDSPRQCKAYYYSGMAYQKLNQYDNAIDCYQQIVSLYPDYPNAWHAQFMIGCMYEELAASGQMDPAAAHQQSQAAHRKVIENYAGSPAADIARQKLD